VRGERVGARNGGVFGRVFEQHQRRTDERFGDQEQGRRARRRAAPGCCAGKRRNAQTTSNANQRQVGPLVTRCVVVVSRISLVILLRLCPNVHYGPMLASAPINSTGCCLAANVSRRRCDCDRKPRLPPSRRSRRCLCRASTVGCWVRSVALCLRGCVSPRLPTTPSRDYVVRCVSSRRSRGFSRTHVRAGITAQRLSSACGTLDRSLCCLQIYTGYSPKISKGLISVSPETRHIF